MRSTPRARLARARWTRALAMPVLALLVLLGTSSVAAASTADHVVLAAEGGHGGELPGPDPAEADDEANEFAPDDYEANFLWGAAVGFGALVAGGLLTMGGLYWLMVLRPAQAKQRQNQPQG